MAAKFKVIQNPDVGHERCALCGQWYKFSGIEVKIYEDNEPYGSICPECREADQETRRNRILQYVVQELANAMVRIQWSNTKLRMPSKDEIETFAKKLKERSNQ